MALHGQGTLPPTELRDARVQLHGAAQVEVFEQGDVGDRVYVVLSA